MSYEVLPSAIAWRTDRIPSAEAPKTLDAVADQKWKGRTGTTTQLESMLQGLILAYGEAEANDKLEKLATLSNRTYTSIAALSDALAQGEIDIAWNMGAHRPSQLKAKGAPVDFVLQDPTFGQGITSRRPKEESIPTRPRCSSSSRRAPTCSNGSTKPSPVASSATHRVAMRSIFRNIPIWLIPRPRPESVSRVETAYRSPVHPPGALTQEQPGQWSTRCSAGRQRQPSRWGRCSAWFSTLCAAARHAAVRRDHRHAAGHAAALHARHPGPRLGRGDGVSGAAQLAAVCRGDRDIGSAGGDPAGLDRERTDARVRLMADMSCWRRS